MDKSSTLSGYVASASPIKLSKPKKCHNNQVKPPKQYFDFYLHGQDEARRGACFSPQKCKILDEISKSQHNQGCTIMKVKLNEENTDFVLTLRRRMPHIYGFLERFSFGHFFAISCRF